MTARTGIVRMGLALVLLASALHGLAEGVSPLDPARAFCAPRETFLAPAEVPRSVADPPDGEEDDSNPILPMEFGTPAVSFVSPALAASGVVCSSDVLLSSDYRTEVFRPPTA
ncbi:MAG: hypothetical protein M1550_04560 [Deltaproteobacteria bacterium]|nr:hypothetical protein [Deltaproteobacteria bacterium]